MRRGQPLGNDSYEFTSAVARAHNAPTPAAHSNLSLLSDASFLERFRGLFAQLDAGALPLDAFRARLASLGLAETPEASRVLQQLPVTFTALQRALKSGNEALSAPDARFGAASRTDAMGPYHTSRQSNIMADVRAGPSVAAREDRATGARESGAGALLRGEGGALPRGATQLEPGERGACLSEHTQHARVTHPSALVESGVGALLRGEPLHPRNTDAVFERARAVLAQVDGGGLRLGDAEVRLGEAGFTPAVAPALFAALKGYYTSGRLDMRGAMAAVSEALRGASGARSFTADADVAPLTAGGRGGTRYKGGESTTDIYGGGNAAASTHARAIAPEGAALRDRIFGGSPEPRALLPVGVRKALDGSLNAEALGGGSTRRPADNNEAQWSAVPAGVARDLQPTSNLRGGAQDPARTRALGSSLGPNVAAPYNTTADDGSTWGGRGLGGPALPGAAKLRDKREMGGKAVEGHWSSWQAPDLSK
jgi:hypothetical protein